MQGDLEIFTIFENCIANRSDLIRLSGTGFDFDDGSDAKKVVSQWRWQKKKNRSVNSYPIRGVVTKTGTLRVCGFNKLKFLETKISKLLELF